MKYYVVEIINNKGILEDDYLKTFDNLEGAKTYARRMKNDNSVIEIRQHIDDNTDNDYNTFDF